MFPKSYFWDGYFTPSYWERTKVVAAPVANFTGAPLSGLVPLSVAFTDASTGSPTSWLWTFGDGSTSTVQNPSHAYSTAGTYTVRLTATNAGGSSVKTHADYVSAISVAAKVTTGLLEGEGTKGGYLLETATANDVLYPPGSPWQTSSAALLAADQESAMIKRRKRQRAVLLAAAMMLEEDDPWEALR